MKNHVGEIFKFPPRPDGLWRIHKQDENFVYYTTIRYGDEGEIGKTNSTEIKKYCEYLQKRGWIRVFTFKEYIKSL